MELIIGKRYRLEKKIGEGGFAEVFLGTELKNPSEKLAIKLEQRTSMTPMLFYEAKILEYLKGLKGIPHLKTSGFEGDYNYIAMEYLGDNLQNIFENNNCKLGLQVPFFHFQKKDCITASRPNVEYIRISS